MTYQILRSDDGRLYEEFKADNDIAASWYFKGKIGEYSRDNYYLVKVIDV